MKVSVDVGRFLYIQNRKSKSIFKILIHPNHPNIYKREETVYGSHTSKIFIKFSNVHEEEFALVHSSITYHVALIPSDPINHELFNSVHWTHHYLHTIQISLTAGLIMVHEKIIVKNLLCLSTVSDRPFFQLYSTILYKEYSQFPFQA